MNADTQDLLAWPVPLKPSSHNNTGSKSSSSQHIHQTCFVTSLYDYGNSVCNTSIYNNIYSIFTSPSESELLRSTLFWVSDRCSWRWEEWRFAQGLVSTADQFCGVASSFRVLWLVKAEFVSMSLWFSVKIGRFVFDYDGSQYGVAVRQCPTVQVVHAEALRPRMLFSSLPTKIGTPLNSQSYET